MNELREDFQRLKAIKKLESTEALKNPITTSPIVTRYSSSSLVVKDRNSLAEANIYYTNKDALGSFISSNESIKVFIQGGMIPKSVNFTEYYSSLINRNYLDKEVFKDEELLLQILGDNCIKIDIKLINVIGHANIKKLIYCAIKNLLKSV